MYAREEMLNPLYQLALRVAIKDHQKRCVRVTTDPANRGWAKLEKIWRENSEYEIRFPLTPPSDMLARKWWCETCGDIGTEIMEITKK